MSNKNNPILKFLKPTKWKIILTLIIGLTFFLFSSPRGYVIERFGGGDNIDMVNAPIGITNINVIILISIVGGYFISSIIVFVSNRINAGKRK